MSEQSVDRRLTAILAADVVAYSRLMGLDEVGTLSSLTQHRSAFIDPTIAACHGRIVKTTGDGLLLEFGSIVDATRCAILLQRGLAERNAALSDDKRIQFRMGVNIGDVIIKGDDIFGDCVNIAARLEALAEPGGICISKAANDQIRDKIKADFVDIGPHEVKNIARPVEVFALSPAAIAALPAAECQLEATAPRRSRRPLAAMAGAVVAALAIAGGAFYLTRTSAPPLQVQLAATLDRVLPTSTSKARERVVADYLAASTHRAFALAPKAQSRWWSADWPAREVAIEKALERCQLYFNEVCATIAVDDAMIAPGADGVWPTADMPRTHYSGSFDPGQIPGVRPTLMKRRDIVGYAAVTGPKAAAYHVRGIVTVVTNAATQRRAEEQALKTCNEDPASRKADGPCYLYAVANDVVLPQRLHAPMTPQ